MKSLEIKSDVCLLKSNSYMGVSVNNTPISDLVANNLPKELEKNKEYPVKINFQIEFLGEDGLNVTTEGYEVKKEETEEGEGEI